MVSAHFISDISELSPDQLEWLNAKHILNLLYDQGGCENFCNSVEEALDCDIIKLSSKLMIKSLTEILHKSRQFTNPDIVAVLQQCCGFAGTFKACGIFLRTFCEYLEDERLHLEDKELVNDKTQLIINGERCSIICNIIISIITYDI